MATCYPYYPGCSLEGTSREFDSSSREVFKALGTPLAEIDDWSCCGATSVHSLDRLVATALPARNLNLVRQQGGDQVAVACAGCYSRLKCVAYELEHEAGLKEQIAEVMEEPYLGAEVRVRHILEILLEDVGAEKLKALVRTPLTGLRYADYYGCVLVRPPKVMQFDDVENPTSMERVLAPTGAQAVAWSSKVECCGASLTLSRDDLVLELVRSILIDARDAGAEVVVVACPLCQTNLDMRQIDLRARKMLDFHIPVVYFTQLLGLSFGVSWKALGLPALMIDAKPVLGRFTGAPTAVAAAAV